MIHVAILCSCLFNVYFSNTFRCKYHNQFCLIERTMNICLCKWDVQLHITLQTQAYKVQRGCAQRDLEAYKFEQLNKTLIFTSMFKTLNKYLCM